MRERASFSRWRLIFPPRLPKRCSNLPRPADWRRPHPCRPLCLAGDARRRNKCRNADPFRHPDALRRIRLIADQEELEQALAFPWEQWGVFLHPSQRALVERSFSGPARVAGSAGTGKTIVAIHRAVRLARENPAAKILLASFSQPLADAMAKKKLVLAPETGGIISRITSASFRGIAEQMHQLEHGVRPRIASDAVLRERLRTAAAATELKGFSERFLLSEWTNVIDAWGLSSLDAYSTVERMGRKSRLAPTSARDCGQRSPPFRRPW